MVFRLLAVLCLAACGAIRCAEAQRDNPAPVQAELLTRIAVRAIRPGDTVYARVTAPWSTPGCTLREGAILEATVTIAVPHSSKANKSIVALAFKRAECGRSLQPLRLTIESVAAPPDPNLEQLPADLPLTPAAPHSGPRMQPVRDPADQPAASAADQAGMDVRRFPMTTNVHPGDVLGIKRLKLSVGSGPDHSSVLSVTGFDLQMGMSTRLLLRPDASPVAAGEEHAASQPGADATTGSAFPAQSDLVTLPTEGGDLDRCAAPDCSPEVDVSAAGGKHENYAGSIPLAPLGFVPRVNREILAPGEDDALAWLGPSELLIAFNPHPLVPRHGKVDSGSIVRVIRAILVDMTNRKVKRVVQWRTCDSNQFLWILPNNRALVHVGSELRIYGPGLRMEKRIGLGGAMAFGRVSPDGRRIAIGVVRERHNADLHARLEAILGKEPEEDVEVLLLNDRFGTLGSGVSSSTKEVPALLNEGEVTLQATEGEARKSVKHYNLRLRTWNNVSRSLGTFDSSCRPTVSTLAPDLLFLVTCASLNHAREYRVLRADGKPLLHGQSVLRDLGHAAAGGGREDTFAVRMFKADGPVLPDEPFHPAELECAELAIYRSQDGKHLFTVRVKDPAASWAGYALSPGGEVAVLSQDGVDVYSMPSQ